MAEQSLTLVCILPSLHRCEPKQALDEVTVPESEARPMIASNRWAPKGSDKAAAAADKAAAEAQGDKTAAKPAPKS